MIRQSYGFNKKFIIGSVTHLVKCWEIQRAVALASSAINHRIDALAIRCTGETAPCAGSVHYPSNDSRTIDLLQSRTAESPTAQNTERVNCLRAHRRQSPDVLSHGEVVPDINTQHLQAATAYNSWQRFWFHGVLPPPPAVRKDDFARLAAVEFEIVQLRPILDVGKFRTARMFITGWNNQVCVISKFTQRISRRYSDKISGSDNICSRSNGRSLDDAGNDVK